MVLQYIDKNLTFLFQLIKFFKCTQMAVCFSSYLTKQRFQKNLTKILKTLVALLVALGNFAFTILLNQY